MPRSIYCNRKPRLIAPAWCTAVLLAVLLATPLQPLNAQVEQPGPEVEQDSITTALLPTITYTSDLGLILGGTMSRYHYDPELSPFRSYTEAMALISTRWWVDLSLIHDRTETFGTDIRSRIELLGNRQLQDFFFGVGNNTVFLEEDWERGLYFFESISFDLSYRGRYPVYRDSGSDRRLDLLMLAGTGYQIPYYDQEPVPIMGRERPRGITGGWVNYLGSGLMWESRDSEFDPTRGQHGLLEISYAPSLLLTDYEHLRINTDLRTYQRIPPLNDLVVAMRVGSEMTFGSPPYWEMPVVGSSSTVRGYPYGRFRGDQSLFYNLELRNWLFTYEELDFRFGAHAFNDGGRVFTRGDSLADLPDGMHYTYGGGLAFSLFTPDFIVRAEMGFSDEISRFYMNVGYMF